MNKDLQELIKAMLSLKDKEECREFLEDLCTPAELSALTGRWKVARMLEDGLSYRDIYEKSGVSTATVTRVARCVTLGAGGYRTALQRRESFAKKKMSQE